MFSAGKQWLRCQFSVPQVPMEGGVHYFSPVFLFVTVFECLDSFFCGRRGLVAFISIRLCCSFVTHSDYVFLFALAVLQIAMQQRFYANHDVTTYLPTSYHLKHKIFIKYSILYLHLYINIYINISP